MSEQNAVSPTSRKVKEAWPDEAARGKKQVKERDKAKVAEKLGLGIGFECPSPPASPFVSNVETSKAKSLVMRDILEVCSNVSFA